MLVLKFYFKEKSFYFYGFESFKFCVGTNSARVSQRRSSSYTVIKEASLFSTRMKTVKVTDDMGESITMQEDAGFYFSTNIPTENIMKNPSFQARRDDILIVTYPKSGTHWMQAIVNLMVENVDDLSERYKQYQYHLEYTPHQVMDNAPSPRVICTHLPFERIPLDFLREKSRIVLCVRNPRDVAVSYFRFCANLKDIDYRGSFGGFFNLFITGKLPYNSWFDHVFSWLKVARSGRQNIHVVRYEDLKQGFLSTVSDLACYLKVDTSPELLEKIQKRTSFENMKLSLSDYLREMSINGQSVIFRKGTVGDWRNYFSPAQVTMLEDVMEEWGLHKNKSISFYDE
ncbi:hypothetical protein EGW08_014168 [Elysia chlorotica]|uniref:Sulfotransferase domain-containing protein n=1 Tax=Elysia chlorotica TaxID=188477 RepID=A0A433T974_ELYCH|nr:hypothetical protein EGW08_014168 [Elysia chlorotica]